MKKQYLGLAYFLPIVGVAVLLTVLSYLINDYPEAPFKLRPVVDLLHIVDLPAGLIGITVSGNVHQPNSVAYYLVLFMTYWLVVGFLVWLVDLALGHRKRSGD